MSEKELQRPKKEKTAAPEDGKFDNALATSPAIDLPPFPTSDITKDPSARSIAPKDAKSTPTPIKTNLPIRTVAVQEGSALQRIEEADSSNELESDVFIPFPTQAHPLSAERGAEDTYTHPIKSPVSSVSGDFEILNELEREILEIARSILKKKKFESIISVDRIETISPLVEELLSKCIAKLTHTRGFPKEEIFKAIQNLEKNLWIVTEQRRTKEEIINNPVLQRILVFIHTHPGTHARDPAIEQELGISRNPFIKHITILEAFGLIRSKKIGRTQNYFSSTVPEIFDDFVVLFENPLVPQIIQLILDNPTINLSELARRLNVYHGAIQYHLKTLMDMNILLKGENFEVNKELLRRYNQLYKVPPFRM